MAAGGLSRRGRATIVSAATGFPPSMQIYVATHKPAPFPEDPGYIPIQNGKAVSGIDLQMLGDDTGQNISDKMPTYSECCALYWMVHNVEADLVGLAHYRRYFTPLRDSVRVGDFDVAASTDFPELASADLVIAKPLDFSPVTVEEQYDIAHHLRDIAITRGAVRKLYPDYTESFDTVMRDTLMTPWNIFVGRMPVVRDYARWLFDVMFLLEDWIPYDSYEGYQRRVFAFLSERLFTVWLHHNRTRWNVVRRKVIVLPY